ncbi:FkbM family methyltransferase [Actinokineospora globicatena]|uniref:Methyltransferase FkbM domain-containing protein n=1 Tax=Actinokineospora globicatena TaxID=103729 RepID=A0A9W6QJU2_9PSEU|nr:FkbM family methyltransferase [Actinokineospora globicatena]GLW89909.1 hypothetical protein Aglo03_07250 [Actinokineospora globicatena]
MTTDRLESTLSRYPGVARARVDRAPDGRLTARVLPWSAQDSVHGLTEVSPTETRFLHDEIFLGETYLQGGIVLRANAVVFDVGANIGMFALFVAARCPSATVHAFEPVPEVFAKLRANVDRYGVTAHLHEIGLSARDERIRFNYYPEISIMSCRTDYAAFDNEKHLIKNYIDHQRVSGPQGREDHLAAVEAILAKEFEYDYRTCQLRRTSSLIAESGVPVIDLLKIDVQRAELDVLRGIDSTQWDLVQQVVMEVHDEDGLPTSGRVGVVRSLLEENGFDVTVSESEILTGAGRFAVQAIRPSYAADPRPVVAALGNAGELDGAAIMAWLKENSDELPDAVTVVSSL